MTTGAFSVDKTATVSGTVKPFGWKFFRFSASAGGQLTVILLGLKGDPDLYMQRGGLATKRSSFSMTDCDNCPVTSTSNHCGSCAEGDPICESGCWNAKKVDVDEGGEYIIGVTAFCCDEAEFKLAVTGIDTPGLFNSFLGVVAFIALLF